MPDPIPPITPPVTPPATPPAPPAPAPVEGPTAPAPASTVPAGPRAVVPPPALAARDALSGASVVGGLVPTGVGTIDFRLPTRDALAITADPSVDTSWHRLNGEPTGPDRSLAAAEAAGRPGAGTANGLTGLLFPLATPQAAQQTGLPPVVLGTMQAGFAVGGIIEAARAGAQFLSGDNDRPSGPNVSVSVTPSSEGGMITVGGQF